MTKRRDRPAKPHIDPIEPAADGDAGEWDGLMYILLDWLDQEWQEMQEAREAA